MAFLPEKIEGENNWEYVWGQRKKSHECKTMDSVFKSVFKRRNAESI
jgi:hypothetical protein